MMLMTRINTSRMKMFAMPRAKQRIMDRIPSLDGGLVSQLVASNVCLSVPGHPQKSMSNIDIKPETSSIQPAGPICPQ